ncbi:MAG: hypothetical protein GY749_47875 [Desulfobacteraceae bacterium]|nr:hypothetical protein [Desulfobacteraceae bacterium]
MSKNYNTIEQLTERVIKSSTIEEIKFYIDKAKSLTKKGKLSSTDLYQLMKEAGEAFRELTTDNPGKASELILEYILPLCITSGYPDDDARITIHNARENLCEWLNQYSETESFNIRANILDQLKKELQSENIEGTCRTISTIGFRRDDIVEELWKVVIKHPDKYGDAALSVISHLGVHHADRPGLLNELHSRMSLRFNIPLIWAVYHLAGKESIEPVMENWFGLPEAESQKENQFLSVGILGEIADKNEADSNLQDDLWNKCISLAETEESMLKPSDLYIRGDLTPHFNSDKVIKTLTSYLRNEKQDLPTASHRRYLLYSRIKKCVLPRQLDGIKDIKEDDFIPAIKLDACKNTGYSGRRDMTFEQLNKKLAWNTALILDRAEVFDWFEKEIAQEENPYLKDEIINLVACFKLNSLPSLIAEWVTDIYDSSHIKDSSESFFLESVISVAQSCSSRESFRVLLDPGLTFNGNVLISSVDALSDVSINLVRSGITDVIDELFQTLIQSEKSSQRTVVAGAIMALAAKRLLSGDHIRLIENCLWNDQLGPHELGFLARSIGFIPVDKISGNVWERLSFLCQLKSEDDWLSSHSMESLARCDRLFQEKNLLDEQIGVQISGGKWNITDKTKQNKWSAYFTGWLYIFHPNEFTPAVISIIEDYTWNSAIQLIQLLVKHYRENSDKQLPEIIQKALIQRTHSQQLSYYSEPILFHQTAVLMPDELAFQTWEWSQWSPDSREALAIALGDAKYTKPEAKARALSHLKLLIGDGLYRVRRSAYRSLATLSVSSLKLMIEEFSENSSVELRKRAAEACAWIPKGEALKTGVNCRLETDPEASVRDTVRRIYYERRNRLWSEEYLQYILNVQGTDNKEILSAWRYAQAIVQSGDDTTLKKLKKHLQTSELQPHMHHWINRIIRDLNKKWEETVKKWPEPWVPFEGTIESGEGILELLKGKKVAVYYITWRVPPSSPSYTDSWGGVVFPQKHNGHLCEKMTLYLENDREVTILPTSVSVEEVYFRGQNNYPE